MKKKIFSIIILTLVLSLLASCAGGGDVPVTVTAADPGQTAVTEDSARLAFEGGDSLSPFKVKSDTNIRLMTLIYDPLFTLDSAYNLKGVIAQDCAADLRAINVTLKTGINFSDGSPVTTQDIIYSFNEAKESFAYSSRLANFESIVAANDVNLVVTLKESDPYAANCLTFPIVKKGSNIDRPLGSGRYVLSEESGKYYLTVNPQKTGFSPSITKFELNEIKNAAVINDSLQIGGTCFNFDDLADGAYQRVTAATQDIIMNNFVYLGVNSGKEVLANADLRRAISAAINREEIVTTAYQGHAKAAQSPFNPNWFVLSGAQNTLLLENSSIEELIAESKEGLAAEPLRLLVNSENGYKYEMAKLIKSDLDSVGIPVTIEALAPEDFVTNVRKGDFELYIGEIHLTDNMNLSELFYGGNCSYGVTPAAQELSAERYEQMLEGKCELMDFINVFASELPFIPLCYRAGLAIYMNSIDFGNALCSERDVFLNVEKWKITRDEQTS